ncbi:MAG: elongation factor Ts [Dehalococcoidales bacterium]
MEIPASKVKELREQSGAGVISCRNALVEASGDLDKAQQILKDKGILKAEKKMERSTTQGIVEAYVHTGGRIGAIVEVNCETDFVARTDEFKELAHNIVMQVAAISPQYISDDEVPEGAEVEPEEACLLKQPFIKDPSRTINDIVVETIAKLGENIRIARFARFEVGR